MRAGTIAGTALAGAAALITLALHTPASITPDPVSADSTAARPVRFSPLRTDFSDYRWPTDATRQLSSTFGEFRSTHFHGGIDIRTNDRTGYPVFASQDGYVSTIAVNPTGYGKMLYVRHPDGYTTTYAHLDGFAPAIQERVAREQRNLARYPVTIPCGPSEFPVRRGETIALTGETGTGTPHLHFEIRDENGDAVNPLLSSAFEIADTILPEIQAVAVIPLGEHSLVNQSRDPLILRVRRGETPQTQLHERIRITGAAGFAVRVSDRANGSWFRHGVYGTRLLVNESPVFATTMDRAPMTDGQQIGLFYHWPLYERGYGRFQKLYMDSANELPFYEPRAERSGFIGGHLLAEGLHSFRIDTRDISGNLASVSGEFVFNHPPSFELDAGPSGLAMVPEDPTRVFKVFVSGRRFSGERWSTRIIHPDPLSRSRTIPVPYEAGQFDIVRIVAENVYGTSSAPVFWVSSGPSLPAARAWLTWEAEDDLVRFTVHTDGIFTAPPAVSLIEGGVERLIGVRAEDVHLYSGAYRPSAEISGVRTLRTAVTANGRPDTLEAAQELWPVLPESAGRFSLAGGDLLLEFEAGSLFGPAFLRLEMDDEEGVPVYRIQPTHTVLRSSVRAGIRAPGAGERAGMFVRRRRGWSLFGRGPADSAGYIWGTLTRALGDVAVLPDASPPLLHSVTVDRRNDRRPVISFRWNDDRAGVDYQSLKLYIDSVLCIPEVDGEHRRAVYRPPAPLPRGPHLLTILLKDNLGNPTTVDRRFVVH